jgi:hypothetical protein
MAGGVCGELGDIRNAGDSRALEKYSQNKLKIERRRKRRRVTTVWERINVSPRSGF